MCSILILSLFISCSRWEEFIKQFDKVEWKEKNKTIIKNLAKALGCDYSGINQQKIAQLDKNILNKTQELLNERKEEWDNWKNKIKEQSLKWHFINQYKGSSIAICLGQLGGRNYTSWEEFIKQFDNVEWKEKNKEIIDVLSSLLYSPNKLIDSEKIDSLDQDVKIMAQKILIEKCEVTKEKIEQSEKRFVSRKNNLISFCFEQLWDENYTSWEEFIKQFDNVGWKEKNRTIIEKLAKVLGCDYSEINQQKIADLDQTIVDMIKKLFDEKRANKLKKKWEENEKQFEQSKNELIVICLDLLWDENYNSWDNFVTKFDDQEWKCKNELIITKLASVLNCSNEEINSKKIDSLNKEIRNKMIDKLEELTDEKTWNKRKEEKENEFASMEKQLEQNKEEIIPFYIAILWWEDNYYNVNYYYDVYDYDYRKDDNWSVFVTQFDDSNWKEKNKEIITKLALALDCSFDEVNKQKIGQLGKDIKDKAQKLLDEKKEAPDDWNDKLNEKKTNLNNQKKN